MTDRDIVTIREYLEQRLDYERTIMAQRMELVDKALALAAAEYERRLTVLNHAHEAAVKEQARVLPRETFDQWKDDFSKWRGTVDTAVVGTVNHSTLIGSLERRVSEIEKLSNKVSGAVILLGTMGLAGVLGFLLAVARIVGLMK